jgi:hypothetical protein
MTRVAPLKHCVRKVITSFAELPPLVLHRKSEGDGRLIFLRTSSIYDELRQVGPISFNLLQFISPVCCLLATPLSQVCRLAKNGRRDAAGRLFHRATNRRYSVPEDTFA